MNTMQMFLDQLAQEPDEMFHWHGLCDFLQDNDSPLGEKILEFLKKPTMAFFMNNIARFFPADNLIFVNEKTLYFVPPLENVTDRFKFYVYTKVLWYWYEISYNYYNVCWKLSKPIVVTITDRGESKLTLGKIKDLVTILENFDHPIRNLPSKLPVLHANELLPQLINQIRQL